MADGFLGRWAKRKEAVRKGEAVPEEAPQPSPLPSPASGRGSHAAPPSLPLPLAGEGRGEGEAVEEAAPPPTLQDTESLTPTSDFTRFVRPDVAPEVKNAAFKKLFADPHFNVMDGLDVYIDDYTRSDPIPPEMLRKMAGARLLGLLRDEDETEQAGEAPRDDADAAPPQSVAQSAPALPPAEHHGDPDLRLQQDDAPGSVGPGAGPR